MEFSKFLVIMLVIHIVYKAALSIIVPSILMDWQVLHTRCIVFADLFILSSIFIYICLSQPSTAKLCQSSILAFAYCLHTLTLDISHLDMVTLTTK